MIAEVSAEEFQQIRSNLNLTVRELSDLMSVHERTVSKWLAGERPIKGPAAQLVKRIVADREEPPDPADA